MDMASRKEYLIPITVEPLQEGGFLARSPLLRGLVAQGRTVAETMEIAQDVARKIIESCLEHGDPLPKGLAASHPFALKAHLKIPVPVAR